MCWSHFLIKLQAFNLQVFKKTLQLNCFPVKFSKLLRASLLKNICKRLLLEVFYKKAVLKYFTIFTGLLLHETPVLESLFNSEYCKIFQSTYFEEHLQTADSENVFIKIIHK